MGDFFPKLEWTFQWKVADTIFILLNYAADIELLRRRHRVIGHFSAGPSANAAHSICLPLILSVEETAFLLYREIAILQSTQPVRNLNPPSPRSLARFDEILDRHYRESVSLKCVISTFSVLY